MRFIAIIAAFAGFVAVSAAPSALVPVRLGEFCTDTGFQGHCVTMTAAAPFKAGDPYGCGDMLPPFVKAVSSARGLTNGYTCFLYSGLQCTGARVVITGRIPSFLDPSVNFNDMALSWSCDSSL